MQENEFEKEVQQKLDGLKLKPSEQVWQHVADAIVKQKTNRRIFAIVLLCLFITTGAIFMLRNTKTSNKIISLKSADNNTFKNNKDTQYFNKNEHKQTIDRQKISVAKRYDSVSYLPTATKDKQVLEVQKEEKEFSPTLKSAKIKVIKSFKTINRSNEGDKEQVMNHGKKGVYRTSRKITVSIKNSLPANTVDEETSLGKTPASNVIEKIFPLNDMKMYGPFLNPYNKIEIKNLQNNLLAIPAKDYSVNKSTIKNIITQPQKHQWKFGLNFSVGASATSNSYLGIVGFGNGNTLGGYAAADQIAGCVNCANSSISHRPSTVKPAVGLVLGVFVQKKITNKIVVAIGFNYKMYNSFMRVGSRVDSAVMSNTNNNLSQSSIFYRAGINNHYKNNFHFLEMPLDVHINLGRQNKHSLYLNAGVSIAQLIVTNALQFDTASAKYYGNNSLFNKTQIGISAGLLFSLSGAVKNPFLIGPDIHFSLNNIAASGLYKNSRYSYFGIKVQKTVGKK